MYCPSLKYSELSSHSRVSLSFAASSVSLSPARPTWLTPRDKTDIHADTMATVAHERAEWRSGRSLGKLLPVALSSAAVYIREMCTIVQAECRVRGMNGLSNAAWFMNDWHNATIAQPLKIIVVRHATF